MVSKRQDSGGGLHADAYRELNPDIETIPGEGLFGFINALGKLSL